MNPMDWKQEFDKRQLQEIEFNRIYMRDFAHGTDGHNPRILIAKMADLLDRMATDMAQMDKDFSEALKISEALKNQEE